MRCPYNGCTFIGTEAEVLDHVDYLKGVNDPEHEEERRRG